MISRELEGLELRPHPHLVILGAGASRAASPYGELNKRVMPVMRDLPNALELQNLLDKGQLSEACADFESFYNDLVATGNESLEREIERRLFGFFDSARISRAVTLYDRLVLSLRRKDTIASFTLMKDGKDESADLRE